MERTSTRRYDVIVVGAGSAGCVVAARLSEDPRRSVLLLEAGPDYPSVDELPPELRSGLGPAFTHDWGYQSVEGALGRRLALPRGKLVGGCSATNAAIALRARPEDFAEWVALGNASWSFDEVVPFFRRLDAQGGAVPMFRYPEDRLLPEHRAFRDACVALGYTRVADHNAPDAIGVGPVPLNVRDGVRQSAALTHLAPARGRPNLSIRGGVLVERIVFDRTRATGVLLAGSNEMIEADRVIVSAGTYASPALLLRSGLGAREQLDALGIDVVANRPGVGANLVDHPLVPLRYAAPAPTEEVPGVQVILTTTSSSDARAPDLQLMSWSPYADATSPEGGVFTLFVALLKASSRGSVRIASRDPAAAPQIDLGYFSADGDLERLVSGVRIAHRLASTAPLASFTRAPLSATARAKSQLERAIRAEVATYHHPVGTCRMGPATDPLAVVDECGAVHGVVGLFVIDASIMPTIPAANPNLTTLMIAERCAASFGPHVS